MNLWNWLTTPDPAPGLTSTKLLKLALRTLLFVLLVTVVSTLLQLTPLGPYVRTFWGSLLLVLVLYIPMMKFLAIDSFNPPARRPGANAVPLSDVRIKPNAAKRRQEKNRFAGVKKAPPKFGGRR